MGGDRGAVRAIGQAVADLGYSHLAAYDHVLGGDTAVLGEDQRLNHAGGQSVDASYATLDALDGRAAENQMPAGNATGANQQNRLVILLPCRR